MGLREVDGVSQYPPYVDIGTLPRSSTNKIRAMTWHETRNAEAISFQLEALARVVFARGGLVLAGTQALTATDVQVQGYLGVTWDGYAAIFVLDQTVDISSLPAGKHLIVALAERVTQTYSYTDPETSEVIQHEMSSGLGKLAVIEGDSSDYPAIPNGAAPVAYLDTTGSPVLTIYDKHPVIRQSSGPTASRPDDPPTGAMYFDTDLGKPVWYTGAGWVDATGASA